MKKGFFMTIEGLDGAGKSTQMALLKEFLEQREYEVLMTREPGGTFIGEKIREVILDPAHGEMGYHAEALLYAASRAQLVAQVILPALKAGKIVICDRFVDSSLVYQGKARGLGFDAVESINEFATQGLKPDLTLYFDLPLEVSLKRREVRGKGDRLEQEKADFYFKVHEAYLELAQRNPQRIQIINANQEVDQVQQEIRQMLVQALSQL